jgi:ribosomal protein S18 acetylase RimI-like enzyme
LNTCSIRPTQPSDTPALLVLAQETGVFRPLEITALEEVLVDFHAANHVLGHHSVSYVEGDLVGGFAYFAPAAMTDRTWHLYWIAVSRTLQARGIGGSLLAHAEDAIRALEGRLLLIETSSQPHYELTRRFYLKHGYVQAATLKDFYRDGDDMLVFSKRLG